MAKTITTSSTMCVHLVTVMVLFFFILFMFSGCQTTRPDTNKKLAQISAELDETNQKVEEMYHRLSVVQFMVDSHERILSDRDTKLKHSGYVKPTTETKPEKAKSPVVEENIVAGELSKESENAHGEAAPPETEVKDADKAAVTATETVHAQADGDIKADEPAAESVKDDIKDNTAATVEISVEGKSPKDIYDAGFGALKEKDYPTAAAYFKTLVKDYPNHDLADNAVYWTGEIFYDQKDYKEAIRIFNRLVETYPNGGKVPDALLKIGFSYQSMSDKANALKYLKKVVVEYPFTGPGGKAEAMLNKIEKTP